MTEVRSEVSKQTLGFTASAVRLNELEEDWYGVLYDADNNEIWRSEKGDPWLLNALWAAEQQSKEQRKPIEAGLERLTSGDTAEAVALKIFGKDKKP